MSVLSNELKMVMTQQNINVKNQSIWLEQIQQRKHHHMRNYLKMVLIKLACEDTQHASANMETQNLLRHLTVKHGLQ